MDIRKFTTKFSEIDETLNTQQREVVELVVHKLQNVFMTGPGGVGKSHTIRSLLETAKQERFVCCVTALTGTAAYELNCGASTLHRWAGIGTGRGNVNSLINRISKKNKKAFNRWVTTDILVIDEISMMDADLFEKLDVIGRQLRRKDLPFGGIVILASGDFYQLPPVVELGITRFAFESSYWFKVFKHNIELTHNYRQSGDSRYLKMLNQIRVGRIRKGTIKSLQKRIIDSTTELDSRDIKPTRLLPVKRKVNMINDNYFSLLKDVAVEYNMSENIPKPIDCGGIDQHIINEEYKLVKKANSSRIPAKFLSKVGAQVMCTVNYDPERGIVNGSRGVVVSNSEIGPRVHFHNGETVVFKPYTIKSEIIPEVFISGIPLIYAWAITIHKCQGSTLDLCIVDLGRDVFEAGQAYVALSRVRSLDGLYITNFDTGAFRLKGRVTRFYNRIRNKST